MAQLGRFAGCIDRGLHQIAAEQVTIRGYVEEVGEVAATLDPGQGDGASRKKKFEELTARFQGAGAPIHKKPLPSPGEESRQSIRRRSWDIGRRCPDDDSGVMHPPAH